MSQVYGAGGKTLPKKGRLGTGSYYPDGSPLVLHRGNVFPGIKVDRPDFTQLNFGQVSRAGISTIAGRNAAGTKAIHPNQSQYNLSTQPLTPAMTVSSANEDTNLQPVTPQASLLLMPHERNTNSASGTAKKPLPYRTVFGASKTMPTDSAFQPQPSAMYRHQTKPSPGPAIEAVHTGASSRTFAHPRNLPPASGGIDSPQGQSQQKRTPSPSFISRGSQWMDPNNSFIAGAHSVGTAQTGTGRWSQIKKGVV